MLEQWEYFVDRICQLEYEDRLVAYKLAKLERWSKGMAVALAIFAPASAATGLLSWLDAFPGLKAHCTIAWQIAIWATTVVAVPFAAYVEPKVERFRGTRTELDKFLARMRAVLSEAHFLGADSPEWARMAREAMKEYSIFLFHEEFSDKEKNRAWDETLATYEQYLDRKGAPNGR